MMAFGSPRDSLVNIRCHRSFSRGRRREARTELRKEKCSSWSHRNSLFHRRIDSGRSASTTRSSPKNRSNQTTVSNRLLSTQEWVSVHPGVVDRGGDRTGGVVDRGRERTGGVVDRGGTAPVALSVAGGIAPAALSIAEGIASKTLSVAEGTAPIALSVTPGADPTGGPVACETPAARERRNVATNAWKNSQQGSTLLGRGFIFVRCPRAGGDGGRYCFTVASSTITWYLYPDPKSLSL